MKLHHPSKQSFPLSQAKKKSAVKISLHMIIIYLAFIVFVLILVSKSIQTNARSIEAHAGGRCTSSDDGNIRATREKDVSMHPLVDSSPWVDHQIVNYMNTHPSRAYFTRLFLEGGFTKGMEIGVASGRFTEHFLRDLKPMNNLEWTMVEPYPNEDLMKRYNHKTKAGSWKDAGLLENVKHVFFRMLSSHEKLLAKFPDESFDFIYLDGSHSYAGVKQEMFDFWPKIRKGGVLAGHDYCNLGEPTLSCKGCSDVPHCTGYTEYGFANNKTNSPQGTSSNQNDVVRAVQEWMLENNNPRLTLHFTKENFTRESLSKDGMDYDLVITNTRTPSWYVVKI